MAARKKVKKETRIPKSILGKELHADLVFFFIPFIISFFITYFFDIHWNFYPDQFAFPPEKFIFEDFWPYVYFPLTGGIIGFVLVKIFVYAFLEEEEVSDYFKKKGKKLKFPW